MKQKGAYQKEGVLGYSTCLFEHINIRFYWYLKNIKLISFKYLVGFKMLYVVKRLLDFLKK